MKEKYILEFMESKNSHAFIFILYFFLLFFMW